MTNSPNTYLIDPLDALLGANNCDEATSDTLFSIFTSRARTYLDAAPALCQAEILGTIPLSHEEVIRAGARIILLYTEWRYGWPKDAARHAQAVIDRLESDDPYGIESLPKSRAALDVAVNASATFYKAIPPMSDSDRDAALKLVIESIRSEKSLGEMQSEYRSDLDKCAVVDKLANILDAHLYVMISAISKEVLIERLRIAEIRREDTKVSLLLDAIEHSDLLAGALLTALNDSDASASSEVSHG